MCKHTYIADHLQVVRSDAQCSGAFFKGVETGNLLILIFSLFVCVWCGCVCMHVGGGGGCVQTYIHVYIYCRADNLWVVRSDT